MVPVLSNPKHERFAQELAKGSSASAAYVAAGYAKSDSNASRLSGNEKVRSRVEELLGEGAEKAGVTIERIVAELAKVGFANMGDFLKATTSGDPFFVYAELTDEQKAALAEVTVEDFKEGRGEDARDVRRIKFKLHDKLGALEKLGKHLGMFKDKVELTGKDGKDLPVTPVTIFQLPDNGRG
ncbi:terminase small subunit [Bosea thiooxidans]|uniref:terminase small subunit n=1 Tax=Bosea thiooxidans TaxID=53254 RepID=UPI00398C2D66